MNLNDILNQLREKSKCEKVRAKVKNYMKSELEFWAISSPDCRKIAKTIYKKNKTEIPYKLIDQLWDTKIFEPMLTGLYLLQLYKKIYDKKTWEYLNKLVNNVENWAHSDQLSSLRSEFWEREDFLKKNMEWSKSKNIWKRRQAAVSLLAKGPVRIPFSFENTMKVLDPILYDKEYYVQKGVGWMLRVLYQQYPKKTFNFLMKHKDIPRVAIRTACEKMTKTKKKKVMK